MERKVQRIVEAALVEDICPITAQDLVAMPEDTWGLLRDRITDRRQGNDGLVARCLACDGSVYIRTARRRGVSLPLFAHYSGNDPSCPWHHGRNAVPDDARAAQYRDREESDFQWSVGLGIRLMHRLYDPAGAAYTVIEETREPHELVPRSSSDGTKAATASNDRSRVISPNGRIPVLYPASVKDGGRVRCGPS